MKPVENRGVRGFSCSLEMVTAMSEECERQPEQRQNGEARLNGFASWACVALYAQQHATPCFIMGGMSLDVSARVSRGLPISGMNDG